MSEKKINSRVILKHDTEENWLKSSFIPLQGEIIIYDKDSNYDYERMKIGDGETNVNDLPFIEDGLIAALENGTTITNVSLIDLQEQGKLEIMAGDWNNIVIEDNKIYDSNWGGFAIRINHTGYVNLDISIGDDGSTPEPFIIDGQVMETIIKDEFTRIIKYTGYVESYIKLESTFGDFNFNTFQTIEYKSGLMTPEEKETLKKLSEMPFEESEGKGSLVQTNLQVTNSSGNIVRGSVASGRSAVAFGAGNLAAGDSSFIAGYAAETYQQGTVVLGASTAGDIEKHTIFQDMLSLAVDEKDLYANYDIYKAQYNELHPDTPLDLNLDNFKAIKYSFALATGESNESIGRSSATFGQKNKAIGLASFASGLLNEARGTNSFVIGQENVAEGYNSFAAGRDTIASGENQMVLGQFNEPETDKYLIIGDGFAGSRRNIFSIDKTGRIFSQSIGDLDEYIYVFNTSRNIEKAQLSISNCISSCEDSALKLVATTTDPLINKVFKYPVNGAKYKYVKIVFKTNVSAKCSMYYSTTLLKNIKVDFSSQGKQDNYGAQIIDMSNSTDWTSDKITAIRLDMPNESVVAGQTTTYIKYIGLFETLQEAENFELDTEYVDRVLEKTVNSKLDSHLYTFETTDKINQFLTKSNHLTISCKDMKLIGTVKGGDTMLYHNFETPLVGANYQYVKMKYKTDAANPTGCVLYCITVDGGPYNLGNVASYTSLGNQEYEVLFNLSNNTTWNAYDENNKAVANITSLRLDPLANNTANGTIIEIEYIGLFTTREEADSYEPYVTMRQVEDKFAELVDAAPETLNTLNELAAALGNDENFAATVATELGNKIDKETLDEALSQKSQVQIITWEEND